MRNYNNRREKKKGKRLKGSTLDLAGPELIDFTLTPSLPLLISAHTVRSGGDLDLPALSCILNPFG